MEIFSVYDSKMEAYLPPFFQQTVGMAVRSFETAAMDQEHQFHMHGADYTLFHIGSWDQDRGQCDMLEAKVALGNALDVRKPVELSLTDVAGQDERKVG